MSNAYFDVTAFGALGDGTTSATAFVQAAIDACAAQGGGTVRVPAGTFRIAPIRLRSHVTLHLDAGATLLGSDSIDEYPRWASSWEGPHAVPARAPLIGGEGLERIAITGRGTIDGNGRSWWERQWAAKGGDTERPLLIRFADCRDVLIQGVTCINSPMWTISPLACDNVTITGVTIRNPANSPNTDGVNPDSCSNVRISDCHIDVGDDCITIKSGKETDGRQNLRACENITVTNCTLVHGHGGVVIGSEMSGCVRNVAISNCVFVGTDRGIRLKARRGRGGVVEDVRASNLIMDGVTCPIAINLFYGCGAWNDDRVNTLAPMPVDHGTPRFRRLSFSGISARGVKYAAAYLLGLPEMYVEDVTLRDVSLRLDPANTEAGDPDMSPLIHPVCRGGVVARHVRGLSMRDVEVVDAQGPSVRVQDCEDVVLSGIVPRPGEGLLEAPVVLRDVRGARLSNAVFPSEIAAAVVVSGRQTRRVRLGDNDYPDAAQRLVVGDDVPAGEAVDLSQAESPASGPARPAPRVSVSVSTSSSAASSSSHSNGPGVHGPAGANAKSAGAA